MPWRAGPDSIYVSNIMYGGQPYSALLKYTGGTTATVEAVYGPMLPDSGQRGTRAQR